MLRLLVFSTLLVFATAGAALAQEDDFARKGIYLGANLAGAAYTKAEDDLKAGLLEALGYAVPVDVEVPLGLDPRAGYRFHPRIAGEVQFQFFPKADVRLADVKVLSSTP